MLGLYWNLMLATFVLKVSADVIGALAKSPDVSENMVQIRRSERGMGTHKLQPRMFGKW